MRNVCLQTSRNNRICQKLAFFLINLQTSWAITREFLELRKRNFFYVFIKSQKSMKCLRYVNKLKIVTWLLCYSLYVK